MIDFNEVKSISIKGRDVKSIARDGITLWTKPSPYEFIERVFFNGTGMFELPITLVGTDTIRAKFQMTSASGNLFGYFDSSSANNNFCLYGSSSSYIRYDGSLARNWDLRQSTGIHDIVFSSTGLVDNGTSQATWSKKSFVGGQPMVGGLPNSTSAKAQWYCYSFAIDGKCNLFPAKRKSDKVVGLYDTLNDVFYSGTFIEAQAPSALMMGNPFASQDD